MRENISLDDFVNEKLLKGYFNRLYKICRSILGKGFRESLDIIGEIVELNKKKVSSGTKVLDWTVPDEWNIRDAYIKHVGYILCINSALISPYIEYSICS